MKTLLQMLRSQLPGLVLGVAGGAALMHASQEARLERMLDAKLEAHVGPLRSLLQSRPTSAPTAVPVTVQAPDSREELRLIREQLAALTEREILAAASSREAAPPAATPPATREQQEATQRGQRVLDDAIARGRWTEDDQRSFHRAIHAGTREDVEAMERGLSLAINSGRLRPIFGDER
jgi:hypothetical protein